MKRLDDKRKKGVMIANVRFEEGMKITIVYYSSEETLRAEIAEIHDHLLYAVVRKTGKRKRIWFKELRHGKTNIFRRKG